MTKETAKKYALKRGLAGLGLFAAAHIKKGEFVIEYTGKKLNPEEVERSSSQKYFFQVDKYWTVDGAGRENTARYVNHSCRPNCEVRIYAKRIRIWAIKNIKPGEELTYDYGEEYFDEFIKPHGCKCEKCGKKEKNQK
jgi:uncharacterized protein